MTEFLNLMGIKEFSREDNRSVNDRQVFAVDWNFSLEDTSILPERRKDLKENPFLLKIFHINDLHNNIYTFDDDYSESPVFSRIVNEVEKERLSLLDNNSGILFLSAGDDCTGSPLDHLTGYDGENFICHPAYSAYSLGGIDATVLGNHDFDNGLQTLKQSIKQDANFPVLSANLNHDGELDGLVYPGAIIVIKGVRIGIIGLTTPGHIRSRKGSEFSIDNPVGSVHKLYKKLSGVCDSIILLSHLGYKLGSYFAAVKLMGDLELASNFKEYNIDLIIGGHTHDFLNINGLVSENIVNNIPIVQAGYNGLFYGKNILSISNQNCLVNTSIIPVGNKSENAKFELKYKNSLTGRSIAKLKKTIGNFKVSKNYDMKTNEVFKDSYENPMANFITDALASSVRVVESGIDFALIDGASMIKFFNSDRGSVNIIDVYKLMPYADTMVTSTITGSELEDLINGNALRINKDNSPNIERGFLHFSSEIRYTFNSTKLISTDILINNIPLESCYETTFTFTMPNFVQGLSRKWEEEELAKGKTLFNVRDLKKEDTGMYARNELLNYIKLNGVSKESGFLIDGRLKNL